MDKKTYIINCERCDIAEYMIFTRPPGGLTYRYMSTITISSSDSLPVEQEPALQPFTGLFGDKPPGKCPICGTTLKKTSIPVCPIVF